MTVNRELDDLTLMIDSIYLNNKAPTAPVASAFNEDQSHFEPKTPEKGSKKTREQLEDEYKMTPSYLPKTHVPVEQREDPQIRLRYLNQRHTVANPFDRDRYI